jgi:hypothetical protein
VLLITEKLQSMELSKLRIIDFYLCFPAELESVSLPAGHSAARRLAKAAKNVYRGPVSVARMFRDMEHLQLAAVRLLAASGIVDGKLLETGILSRTDTQLTEPMLSAIDRARQNLGELATYVISSFNEIPLLGEKGLKRRTGLMEHRYDPA